MVSFDARTAADTMRSLRTWMGEVSNGRGWSDRPQMSHWPDNHNPMLARERSISPTGPEARDSDMATPAS
eukprot:2627532-Alexandrium_andersonii.AAC.1